MLELLSPDLHSSALAFTPKLASLMEHARVCNLHLSMRPGKQTAMAMYAQGEDIFSRWAQSVVGRQMLTSAMAALPAAAPVIAVVPVAVVAVAVAKRLKDVYEQSKTDRTEQRPRDAAAQLDDLSPVAPGQNVVSANAYQTRGDLRQDESAMLLALAAESFDIAGMPANLRSEFQTELTKACLRAKDSMASGTRLSAMSDLQRQAILTIAVADARNWLQTHQTGKPDMTTAELEAARNKLVVNGHVDPKVFAEMAKNGHPEIRAAALATTLAASVSAAMVGGVGPKAETAKKWAMPLLARAKRTLAAVLSPARDEPALIMAPAERPGQELEMVPRH